jgi:hypothetical protein
MQMRRGTIIRCVVLALLTGVVLPSVGEAQRRGRSIGVGIGLSAVGSRGTFDQVQRAIHLQASGSMSLGARTAAALVFDAYAMSESVAEPGCLPGGACEAETVHPGSLLGLSLELRTWPWERGLSLAAGGGMHWGPNVKGSRVSSSSPAISIGADYEFGNGAILPSVGFRLTALTSDIAAVRWMASPALAFRF